LGNVFRTKLIGKDVVLLTGESALKEFYDGENVTRKNPLPVPFQILAGGCRDFTLFLDGEQHKNRKKILLDLLRRDRLELLFPSIVQSLKECFDEFLQYKQFSMEEKMWPISSRLTLRCIIGVSDDFIKKNLNTFTSVAKNLVKSVESKIQKSIPGNSFSKGIEANKMLFNLLHVMMKKDMDQTDWKSTIPSLKDFMVEDLKSGIDLSLELACRELVHFCIGLSNISVVVSLLTLALLQNPDAKQQLQKEIENVIKDPNATPSSDELDQLVYTDSFIRETLRFYPSFPTIITGTAKREFVADGKIIPSGVGLIAYLYGTNHSSTVYSNPEKFDPSRFSERSEDTKGKCPLFAYVPQGGGKPAETHRCAGEYFIRYILKISAIQLVSLYQLELPPQDLSFDMKKAQPFPKSGMKITFQKKETKAEE